VVNPKDDYMLLRAQLCERGFEDRPASEIVRSLQLVLDRFLQLRSLARSGCILQVNPPHFDAGGRVDALKKPAVSLGEGRPQHLVATHDFAERPLQRHHVEPAPQPERKDDVVGAAQRIELMQEPEPFL
jgi:hypothetical protein